MLGDKMLKVDIVVIQKPSYIEFECPYCEEEINISYSEFSGVEGHDPYEWHRVECPNCEKEIEIDGVDWD